MLTQFIYVSLSDSSVILKNHKEKLLGLFFSLLVNHNPLHRSSGVAGLIALVSSALLDEQEGANFELLQEQRFRAHLVL